MSHFDPSRWPELSPLLDEWLALPPAQRAERLAALQADDPALAAQMALLLDKADAAEQPDFLGQPPLRPRASRAGQPVGPYRLIRELGQGGMGSVWLAQRADGRYDGQVAIKFLHAGLLRSGDGERFAREGRILAQLTHPHIARLLDAGLDAHGAPYLVLEHVDGLPMDRYCSEHALDLPARLRLFLDVLDAVAHAHSRLVLHRDLKPANILVTGEGQVKLLDFGIAKLMRPEAEGGDATELTQRAGRAYTLHYAAPEQVQGGEVSTATDVYALGVLLFQLLVGRHPLLQGDAGPLDTMRQILEAEPPRMSQAVLVAQAADTAVPDTRQRRARALRGDLDTIVAKALKKTAAERYQNAAALAEDLRHWLALEPITARPDSMGYITGRFMRRHWLGVTAAAMVFLSLTGGLGVAWWKAQALAKQHAQAEGLVAFMLGDLRKRLAPVGRLDALDAVGERALAYYAEQQPGDLDADALGRRARALHLIGELADQRGQLARAEQLFQQASDSTAALLARDPHHTARIFDHAQSRYWSGYIAWRQGQADQAELGFNDYLHLAEALVRAEPQQPDWLTEQASAWNNLGVLFLDTRRLPRARQAFEQSVAAWRRLGPTHGTELANALGWQATALDAAGELAQAEQVLQDKLGVLAALPNAESDRQVAKMRANTWNELAYEQLGQGHVAAARSSARAALAGWTALVAVDPDNLEWQANDAMARLVLVQTLAMPPTADLAAARQLLQTVAGLAPRLAAGENPRWRVLVPARWLAARLRWAPQPGLTAEATRWLAQLPEGHWADDEARAVAELALRVGDAEPAAPAARAQWLSAQRHLQPLAGPSDPRAQALLDEVTLRLARPQAGPGLRR